MPLKIVGAGFGRTGTTSLKDALEQLGYRTYHMSELLRKHPEHIELWIKASQGEKVDWDLIFADYDAAVDWPACAFYEQLMDLYPEAKVILTERDADSWYKSAKETIYELGTGWAAQILGYVIPFLRKKTQLVKAVAWDNHFKGKFGSDPEYAKKVFLEWNNSVKNKVPKEKLLVFKVTEGWDPLCKFLNIQGNPDGSFPHSNEAESMKNFIKWQKRIVIGSFVTLSAIGTAVIAVAIKRLL